MDNTINENEEYYWVRCEKCKHKLYYLISKNFSLNMKMKCKSCKHVNEMNFRSFDDYVIREEFIERKEAKY